MLQLNGDIVSPLMTRVEAEGLTLFVAHLLDADEPQVSVLPEGEDTPVSRRVYGGVEDLAPRVPVALGLGAFAAAVDGPVRDALELAQVEALDEVLRDVDPSRVREEELDVGCQLHACSS